MMKGAVEEKNAATMGALDFDETFLHERESFVLDKRKKDRKKTGRKVRQIEVAEAENHTCSEQHLAETGVA